MTEEVAPAPAGQSGGGDLGEGRPPTSDQVTRQGIPSLAALGGETDPEAPGQRLVDATLRQQAAPGPPAGQAPEHVLVELGRPLVQLDRAAPPGAPRAAALVLLQLHARALGEQLQRAGKSTPSIFSTKVKMSPPSWQPWQYQPAAAD